MQVAQYIRQPIRQRRKVKRRLTVKFNPSQSDLLAVDSFEHRDRGRMIGPFIGQACIEAFDLFALALQTARDLHFDQVLDAHGYRQQVGQPYDLIIVTYEDRLSVAFDTFYHATSLDDLAPRAVNASAPAPDQPRLLLLFNFPFNLQQAGDFVLLDHGRKRGFEALFITVLMSATPRPRRQPFDLRVSPPQPRSHGL